MSETIGEEMPHTFGCRCAELVCFGVGIIIDGCMHFDMLRQVG